MTDVPGASLRARMDDILATGALEGKGNPAVSRSL